MGCCFSRTLKRIDDRLALLEYLVIKTASTDKCDISSEDAKMLRHALHDMSE